MGTMIDRDEEYETKYRPKVKPCPFCGVPPTIFSSGEGGKGLMIHCVSENCPNPSTSYYEHEATLRVWNQRTGNQ